MTDAALSPIRALEAITGPYAVFEMYQRWLNDSAAMFRLAHAGLSNPVSRQIVAAAEICGELTFNYKKPKWHLKGVDEPRHVLKTTFDGLLHFDRPRADKLPPLLLVAPRSGHYATLLRDTVKTFLSFHDVYITDPVNAREVPLSKGTYGFHDHLDEAIAFMDHFKGEADVIAVCQPGPAYAAAAALMHQRNDPNRPPPRSLTVMGSPIDVRKSPTAVTNYAEKHSLAWFGRHVICPVSLNHPGAFRPVYPGSLQRGGFISMNLEKHVGAYNQQFNNLIRGDGDSADKHRTFYREYLAVMDLPADFYFETVDLVFHKAALAGGTLEHRGELVDLKAVDRTAIRVVEGELDDISGGIGPIKRGQAYPLIDLCPNAFVRDHYLQKGVGHYGIFNGSRFRKEIAPYLTNEIYADRGLQSPQRGVVPDLRTQPQLVA